MNQFEVGGRMTAEEIEASKAKVAARARGDEEAAAHEYQKRIRLLPSSLMALKLVYGAAYVRERGYNTARADQFYGPGWLDE